MEFDINNPKTYSSIVNGYVISNNVGVFGRSYKVYGSGVLAVCTSASAAIAVAAAADPGPHKEPLPLESPVEPPAEQKPEVVKKPVAEVVKPVAKAKEPVVKAEKPKKAKA